MRKFVVEHKKAVISGGILCLQLIAILIYNLTMLRYQADFDSSSGMFQIAEIWRQKTFLLRNWEYQTTVGWDNPLPLAVLFYGLTKNVFLSLGIANNLFLLAYAFVVYDILKKSGVKAGNIFILLIVLFTPFTTGQLGYFPMLFIGTASYSMKVLITLLLIDILVRLETGSSWKKVSGQTAALVVFCLISGISSGIYMLVCGIAPVILYLGLKVLCRNDLKLILSKPVGAAALAVAAIFAGILCGVWLGFENNSSSMLLLPGTKLAENALHCFVGIWELFGAVGESTQPVVVSKDGIVCLFGVVIVALLLFVIFYYGIRVIRGKEKRPVVGVVLCVEIVNMCVLLLTDTTYASEIFEYRYHIVAMVPALLLLGIFFQEISEKLNFLCRNTILFMVTVACLAIGVTGFSHLYAEEKTGMINDLSKITDLAREQGTDLIYVISIDGKGIQPGRILRVCDTDIQVATLVSENIGIGWGGSTRYFENGNYEGKIMVMVAEDKVKKVPEYLTSRMEKVGEVLGYDLYVCETNIFDCSTGLPVETGEKTVDFPYSPSYVIYGEVNAAGELEVGASEGIVMYGSEVEPQDGVYDLRLNYRVDASAGIADGQSLGTFGIYAADDDIKGQVEIIAGQECRLNGVEIKEDMGTLHYSVIAYPDSGLILESIVAEKIK